MRLEQKINDISGDKLAAFIAIAGAILFIPFLGAVPLFDWDENNFAEAAREMIVTGEYLKVQINFEPFYEKPPLFFWLQVISMKFFGINEFAARFPNAACGIITLVVLFNIGRKLYNNFFGIIWILAYIGSFLPHFYFKTGIIDPVFNLFIFLGLYFFIKNSLHGYDALFVEKRKERYINFIISGVFLGLAILTKGPVGLLIPLLCIATFFIIKKFRKLVTIPELLIWGGTTFIVAMLWFGIEWMRSGPEFVVAFTIRQWELLTTGDAGHGQPFYYHFIVLLIGCFPASILMIKGHRQLAADTFDQNRFRKWMIILFWVVLILFSLVKTKIIHYSSMTYIPMTFLAAHFLYHLRHDEIRWNRILTVGLAFFALVFSAVFILLPLLGKNPDRLALLIDDPFAVANLDASVGWQGWEIFIGILFFIGMFFAFMYINFGYFFRGSIIMFLATALTVQLLLPIVMPKLERYIQGSAIDFYKSMSGRDAYIKTLGFKSYGYLFYSKATEHMDETEMLQGDIKKPAYFVSKIPKAEEIALRNNLEVIGEENGYVFLKRPQN